MTAKKKGDSLTIEGKLKAALVPEAAQPDPIPENWLWTRITALADQRRGVSYSKSDASSQPVENSILVLRGGNIQHGEFQIGDDCVYVPNDYVSASQILQIGDVIIVASSGSKSLVGKAAQVKDQMPDTSFGAFLTLFRPYQPIDAKYFGWFFQSRYYRNAISEASIGININNLRREHFEALTIPLPPLPEQRRIAEKLESLLGKIKEARVLLGEIPEILQNFRQMVLSAACSGRLTEDWRKENQNIQSAEDLLKRKKHLIYKAHLKGLPSVSDLINDDLPSKWVFATLPYLVSTKKYSIKRGPFGSSLRKEYFVESGYKVYEQQHAIKNDFTLGNYYISRDKFNELKAFEVNEGDLIMSCSGTIGRIAVVPRTFEKGIINQALLKLTLDNEVILTDFFLFMFEDYLTKQEFASMTKGNAITNIASVTELKKIYFPLPPLSEQTEIVRCVESLFSKADDLEAQYKEAMELIESLPEIILSKAFHGELVPQDPNDEPAIKLLQRTQKSLMQGADFCKTY